MLENDDKNKTIVQTILFVLKQTSVSPGAIFIVILAALACAGETAMLPYFTKTIIDIVSTVESLSLVNPAMISALCLIGLLFFIEMTWRIYGYMVEIKSIPKLRKNIVESSIDQLFQKSYKYYNNATASSLATHVMTLCNTIPELLNLMLNTFLSKAMIFIFSIALLWQTHIQFAILMLGWTVSFGILLAHYLPKVISRSKDFAEQSNMLSDKINDSLANVLAIRLFANWHIEKRLISTSTVATLKKERHLNITYMLIFCCVSISFVALQALSLYWLIKEKQIGTITVGDFALVLGTNYQVVDLLWALMQEIISFSKSLSDTQIALNNVYAKVEMEDNPQAKNIVVNEGIINFHNVTFKYTEDSRNVFEKLNCTILGGQKVGIVGHSGCGKSTFINLLLRLYDIQNGQITIDNQDISMVTQDSLHFHIGVIQQSPAIFQRTLMDNIKYGNVYASDDEVIDTAKKAFAHDFIISMPQKYESLVGDNGAKISGGQRQRIEIARIFLKNAPILVLDEATSQLDSITEKIIHDSLWELMQGKTTIVVAHRLSTLARMDRILVFDGGKIVQDGPHAQLIRQAGIYKKLWDTQINGFISEYRGAN
jgi:ATP-binding cassette subfamily B protein